MTRFQRELSGELGEIWKKHAEKDLEKVRAELAEGKIIIDAEGVARNCIGRVLMDDLLEQLCMVTDRVSIEATRVARAAEVETEIEEYRRAHRPQSAEDLAEMRAAFGADAVVVDALTKEKIRL